MAMRLAAPPTLEQDYKLLGVARDASPEAIKRRYRRLARTCHPDRFFGNTQAQLDAKELMQAVNDAFARVRSAPLRARPDAPASPPPPPPSPPATPASAGARSWRVYQGRLDPAVREALIESLRMPSVLDLLDQMLPLPLGIGAAFLATFGLGRALADNDWTLIAMGAFLGVCACLLRRRSSLDLAGRWSRGWWGRK